MAALKCARGGVVQDLRHERDTRVVQTGVSAKLSQGYLSVMQV